MSSSQIPPYTGSCLCGSIAYEVDHIERHMAHCHCTMCRKFHGAAFATFGEVRQDNFRWIRGTEFLQTYIASNGTMRQFCNQCGSSMTFKASQGQDGIIEFALGTLDSELKLHPDAHIFVESKASWFELNDLLPKYAGGRDSDKEL